MGVLYTAVDVAFRVYTILIFIRIVLSWIRHNPYQPVFRFIYEITDPYLRLFRKIIPPFGPMDFSPIVALFALQLLEWLVKRVLLYLFFLI
ncbi:YggT family protein [Pelotomaculum terephthalicicum JT]|uniref:YggT family protein n=1 Tax=Pelotomaculum TaxID=191373 RepID=UPI0009C9B7B4|nr:MULTISPECIES: YggT family protein [Pelotomaculum]MCG9969546.1 YggT family protein [Pelotomaculum terephthalicicum JT]OPX86131.1 MAG: YGGT family protein [Pelotomaculum sp. PtaB.Bin117]OPY59538.1 MAG: YGGT family protein [Pelotomaculum sp. PtaU1.Bin035]